MHLSKTVKVYLARLCGKIRTAASAFIIGAAINVARSLLTSSAFTKMFPFVIHDVFTVSANTTLKCYENPKLSDLPARQ